MTGVPARADRLVTPRLILRRARISDLADLHRAFGDPRAMRYWSTPEHASVAETKRWMGAMLAPPAPGQPENEDFVIEYQGRVIGKAGAWILPEVGFLLHPDRWGLGIATEAMRAIIPYLFATYPTDRLTADVDPRNAASLRLLARLGFVETHRAEKTFRWRDEWADSIYLSLLRSKWPPLPS